METTEGGGSVAVSASPAGRAGRPIVAVDVARAAGVSQKTVSRVVNGDPQVGEELRGRVLRAIDELDYRPNRAAQNLVLGHTKTIGVLSVGTTDFGPSALLVATARAIRAAGYVMSVVNTIEPSSPDDAPLDNASALRELVAQGVDAVIINEPVGNFNLAPGELGGLPVLSVSGEYGISSSETVIDADHRGGAMQATRHLLDLGHRTVHHVTGPPTERSSILRTSGWHDELIAAGAPVMAVQTGNWSSKSGYVAGRLLAVDPDVTAVFCANDHMAIGVLGALREAGRRVPEDVSVVGFDDIPEAPFLAPALTTIRADLARQAALGVELLVAAIEDPGDRRTFRVLPVELIERETTGRPSTRG